MRYTQTTAAIITALLSQYPTLTVGQFATMLRQHRAQLDS